MRSCGVSGFGDDGCLRNAGGPSAEARSRRDSWATPLVAAAVLGLPGCSTTPVVTGAPTPDAEAAFESGTDAGGDSAGDSPDSQVPPVAVPLTGCASVGYGAPVTIGGQTFQLSVDTGSTDMGVALTTCSDCGVSPEYAAPGGSCSGSAMSDFGGGSMTSGWTAKVCAADVQVGSEKPTVSMAFAGITTQTNFFISYDCAGTASEGILGLGPIDLDTIGTTKDDAYFTALVQKGVPDTLALLLCSTKGVLWFGGYDATYAAGPPEFTPMSMSASWAVNLLSIGVGMHDVGGADSLSLIDTGTWGFYMPTEAYNALVAALGTDSGAASVFGAGALDANFFQGNFFSGTCVAPLGGQSQAQINAALPPMTLTLPKLSGGSFTLSLPATQSYLAPFRVKGSLEYCSAIADNAMIGNVTILGNAVLQAYITILDEGSRQVGFAPQHYCL